MPNLLSFPFFIVPIPLWLPLVCDMPKGNQNAKKQTENKPKSNPKQTENKGKVNVKVNDKDKVTVKDKEKVNVNVNEKETYIEPAAQIPFSSSDEEDEDDGPWLTGEQLLEMSRKGLI